MLVNPIDRQITQLQKKTQTQKTAAEPQELFRQIRPLLTKLQITTMADAGKTELVEGKIEGENSLYKIVLRRNAQLDGNVIERLKRNEKNFSLIQWSTQALELYLWWPYTVPQEQQTEEAVPAPVLTASQRRYVAMELKETTEQIDKIAEEIQGQDPSIALALDKVCDFLEKEAGFMDAVTQKFIDFLNRMPKAKAQKIIDEIQKSLKKPEPAHAPALQVRDPQHGRYRPMTEVLSKARTE